MKIGNTSYKFILHKTKGQKYGYIYLRKIRNREKKHESLGLPKIHERFWNEKQERVKQLRGIDYQLYNDTITQKIMELTNSNDYLTRSTGRESSFIEFFQDYLSSEQMKRRHGTRRKYQSVLNKVKKHLQHLNKRDLSFSDLSIDYIHEFREFCLNDRMSSNGINHYLKIIHSIIGKAQKTPGYFHVTDPFTHYSYPKTEKTIKTVLDKEEIQRILRKDIQSTRLQRVRNMFLFQLFTKGMRASDLLTLRFHNLIHGRIRYRMFKTRSTSDTPISPAHIELLEHFIQFGSDVNSITIKKEDDISSLIIEEVKMGKRLHRERQRTLNTSHPPGYILQLGGRPIALDHSMDHTVQQHYRILSYEDILDHLTIPVLSGELDDLIKFKTNRGCTKLTGKYTTTYTDEYDMISGLLDDFIDVVKNKIGQIRKTHHKACIDQLHEMGIGELRNSFVFPILKDNEYRDIQDFENIDASQYIRINKSVIVYNRNLKELQQEVGLKKKLTSHLPRVTYTNLMLNLDGVSAYDIMEGLSHSSLSITDVYLRTGFKKDKTDDIQDDFINSLKD